MIQLKVMIVEDDKFLLEKISKILKREVSEVYSFETPTECLNNISVILPDIIISDIRMPEMTGLDMYKELKKNNLNIPIILASAFSEPEYFIEAIKLKVRNFIVKPIDVEDLIEELRQFEKELSVNKELQIKEKILTIQSKMAAMGEMLSNIAHQWKQPLNNISICASNIKIEKELGNIIDKDDTISLMIDNIMNSIQYMNNTVNDFQDYLKPNKLNSCFYIKDTLNKVDKLISSQIKIYNINLIEDIDETIHICSYQNELIQSLINIVKNAIDELKKTSLENRIIKVSVYSENNKVVIEIHDNAGGIPENIVNKIFMPYFTTKNEEGTGIGLYMTKQIVENHLLGTISVTNEKLENNNNIYLGAKFRIEINSL